MRGRVKAFNADNGELVWTFYTIPGRGEPGNETWPQDNEVWQHGGGTVWHTPAADPELGLIYFSTGNPGPDFNGAVRKGDNLYTSSIVAIEAKTGEYRWHFQQVHHDIWDFDSPSPVVLFDLAIDGRERRGLAQPSKTGWVYILDRTDGTPLVGIDEQPVPQEPRQATAADAARPARRCVRAAAPRHRARRLSARERRPHLHAVLDRLHHREARHSRRRELAAERLRSCDGILVCLRRRRRELVQRDGHRHRAADRRRVLHGRHVRHATRLPQYGTFTALDLRTNKIVWQQHWAEHVLQRRDVDRRRARVRRPQRRPAHGARLERRQEALGIPNGRRHERARRACSSTWASSTSSRTRPGICSRARRRATASGCSRSTARSSRQRRQAVRHMNRCSATVSASPSARAARCRRCRQAHAQTIRRAPAFADDAPRRTADDELGDQRRRLVQPPLFAARRASTAATSRRSKASGARTCAARVSGRSTPAKRSRSSMKESSTSSPARTTCSPSASTAARSSGNTAPTWTPRTTPCVAAGRAAAWDSATARSTSANSTASSSRSINATAASSGPCKPSAGKKVSRSPVRRSISTGSSTRASPAASAAFAAA